MGAAGAVRRAGFSTTMVRSHEAGLMGPWGCQPTTIVRVGGPAPSWLRTFVVKNSGLARAAGPIVIAPQPGWQTSVAMAGPPSMGEATLCQQAEDFPDRH